MHDMLNLVRQAAAASERTQQAAKYAEMSASAAGLAGQQAMIRAMNLLATDGEPTASPFQPHPFRKFGGLGILRTKLDKDKLEDDVMTQLARGKRVFEAPVWPAFVLPRDMLPG